MKILLTGAHGFTGRHFAEHATAAGHEVVALQADLTDRAELHREVLAMAPEMVVHLAAISFVGHADLSAFYAINVLGTTNLLDALVEMHKPPQRVLLASSANVYGNSEQSPLSEAQRPAPVNHYAMSKLAMEHMAMIYADRLDLVISRPFNYTGAGQDENFLIPKLARHFSTRAHTIALGNLNIEREFNDVEMVCDAYINLLRYGASGETYNICSGQPYTLRHVIDTFEKLTGHKIRVEINQALVRRNEVHRLYGNPEKLTSLFSKHSLKPINQSLETTLRRMLSPV